MIIGTGTAVNVATVLVGSSVGVLAGNRLPDRTRDLVTDALGLVTLLIAALSAVAVTDPALAAKVGSHAPLLIVLGSLVVGGIVGSLLRLEQRVESPRRLAAAAAVGRVRLGGAGAVHRGVRDRVAGVLHRAADDPRLAVRRAGPRRRPALPEGHPRRLRGDRVRRVVRLGGRRERPDRAGRPGQRSPRSAPCSATCCRTPELAAVTAAGGLMLVGVALRLLRIREIAVADLLPGLVVAPLLVQAVAAFR